MIELAHRSPEVHDVSAHVVWAADKFEIEYGDAPRCVHKPFTGGSRERGARMGAYAVIRYKNGSPNFLYMNGDDIEDIRDKSSKSKNSEHSPWKRFPDEMWRKTAAKRLLKYCRLSIEDLSRAIGLDDQADAAEVPQNGQRADTVSQELALDAPLLDLAEQATHELRGSVERQERVAEEKIAEMQSKQAPVTGAASGTYRDLTDEENKALDKAIVEQEKRKEQAQPAQPVRRKLF